LKVLVIGGMGFTGSHVVDGLLARGCEVRVMGSANSAQENGGEDYWHGDAEILAGDARDPSALERALSRVHAVFYNASRRIGTLTELMDANVTGVARLYEAVEQTRAPVEKIVVASTRAVYGEGQHYCEMHGLQLPPPRAAAQLELGGWGVRCGQCKAETAPVLLREGRPNPASAYGITKLAQEVTALGLGKNLELPTTVLRYSNVIGPRLPFSADHPSLAGLFARAAREGMSLPIFEDGHQLRDFIHVSDVVDATLQALNDRRSDGQVYNVGSGRAVTVLEFARVLSQAAGGNVESRVCGIYRPGDVRHSVASAGKLETLGWKPFKSLREALDDLLAWLDSVPDAEPRVSEALEAQIRRGRIRGVTLPRASAASS
jgi:dTDP-L-rhamnose 4-epimerase